MRRDWVIAALIAVVLLGIAAARGIINANSIVFFVALIPSIILHEVSHGFVANLFGDDTAKRSGRLSLNPFVHIDLFGSLILPGLMILVGIPPLGYAKPVPVDISRLRHPRNQAVLVGLVGPFVNLVLAIAAGFAFRSVIQTALVASPLASQNQVGSSLLVQFLADLGLVNVALMVFNLIPIPPLDGSAVIERFLPAAWWSGYLRVRRFALPVVFLLVLLDPTLIATLIGAVDQRWINLFVPAG
ncbi:MAG: site-2 protease family protein [Acidimicrobiales bacterium]